MPLLPVEATDLLVILGGPMSVYEQDKYPWLTDEIELIKATIAAGRPVFGLCLGGQLMSAALGGKVTSAGFKEIGWRDVYCTGGPGVPDDWPEQHITFQWHGDVFTIPEGTVRTARSELSPNQAFVLGQQAIGTQFHVEYVVDDILAMIARCPDDAARFCKEGGTIESLIGEQNIDAARRWFESMLEWLGG